MDKATQIMQAAIDASAACDAELSAERGKPVFGAYAETDADIGKVGVWFVHAESPCLGRATHARKSWRLNGKTISQAKLIAAINAA